MSDSDTEDGGEFTEPPPKRDGPKRAAAVKRAKYTEADDEEAANESEGEVVPKAKSRRIITDSDDDFWA